MTSGWARFWAVDLHVHTPGSSDTQDEDFGTAADIVQAALDAGVDAIAVTDHNTASWCSRMAEAANRTNLVVLPGFELSTSDGHLLGIWEEGTAPSAIEDVLIRLGIERSRFGDLNVVSAKSMAECASEIRERAALRSPPTLTKSAASSPSLCRRTSISCWPTRTSKPSNMC